MAILDQDYEETIKNPDFYKAGKIEDIISSIKELIKEKTEDFLIVYDKSRYYDYTDRITSEITKKLYDIVVDLSKKEGNYLKEIPHEEILAKLKTKQARDLRASEKEKEIKAKEERRVNQEYLKSIILNPSSTEEKKADARKKLYLLPSGALSIVQDPNASEEEKKNAKKYLPARFSTEPVETKQQKERRLFNIIFSRDPSTSEEEKQKAREELYSDPAVAKQVMNAISGVPDEERKIASSFYRKSGDFKALTPEQEKAEEDRLEKLRKDTEYLRNTQDIASRKRLEIAELKSDPYNLNIDEESFKKIKEKDIEKVKEYLSELGYIAESSREFTNFSKLVSLAADLRAFSYKISNSKTPIDRSSLNFVKKVLNDKIKEIRIEIQKQQGKSTSVRDKIQLIDIDEKNKEKNMAIASAAKAVKDVIYKVITKDDAISFGLYKVKSSDEPVQENLTESIRLIKKQNIIFQYVDLCLENIQKSLFDSVKLNVVLSEGKLLLEANATDETQSGDYDPIFIERMIDEEFSSYLNNQKISKLKTSLKFAIKKFNSIIQDFIPDTPGAEKLSSDTRKMFVGEAYAEILDSLMQYSQIFKKINEIASNTDSSERKELLKDIEDLKEQSAKFTTKILTKSKTINKKPFLLVKNFENFLNEINSEIYLLAEETKQTLETTATPNVSDEEGAERPEFRNVVSRNGKFAIAAYDKESNEAVRLASPFLTSLTVANLIASRMNANKVYFFITPEIAEKFKIPTPSKLPIEKGKSPPELKYGLFTLGYDYIETQPPVWMSNKDQLDKIIDSRKFEDARLTINDLSPKELKSLEKEKAARQKAKEISAAKAKRAKEIEAGGEETQATTEIPTTDTGPEVSNIDQMINIWKDKSFGADITDVFQGINLFTKYKSDDKDLEPKEDDMQDIKTAKEKEKNKRDQKRREFKQKYEEAISALGEKASEYSEKEKVAAFLLGLSGISKVNPQKVNDFLDIVGIKRFTRNRGKKELQEGYYGGKIMIIVKARKPIIENKIINDNKKEEIDLIKERLMRLAGLLE